MLFFAENSKHSAMYARLKNVPNEIITLAAKDEGYIILGPTSTKHKPITFVKKEVQSSFSFAEHMDLDDSELVTIFCF